MKKVNISVIFFITMIFLSSTVEGASSVEDIAIKEINVYENEGEVHVTVINLPRPIGFSVLLNGKDITENCRIRFGTDLFAVDSILVIQLSSDLLNVTNILYIYFYDQINSKEFIENFEFFTSESFSVNWWLIIGLIAGFIIFNVLGGFYMKKKGKNIDKITDNPLTKLPSHKEMTIKTILALVISIALFIYTYFNPYFYYPQLVDHNWGFAYDFLDYFSMGGFLVVIVGLSHHLFLLSLGRHRKMPKTSEVNTVGIVNHYFHKVIGGKDVEDNQNNRERNPSLVAMGKAILVLTMVFALRILMQLLLSTLYEYSPNNFMLVLTTESLATHSLNQTLITLLIASGMIFLICTIFSTLISLFNLYRIVFKKSILENRKDIILTIIRLLAPGIFFSLYLICIRIIPAIS